MTREEFVEDWAVAQIMPGPNVVNISLMIGDCVHNMRAALDYIAWELAGYDIKETTTMFPICGTADEFNTKGIDAGPVLRQLLTRTEGFFGGPDHLTLSNKLVWGQVPERAMRTALIVVEPPRFDDALRLGE